MFVRFHLFSSLWIVLIGLHREGTTVRTLFTLLFWDIIFTEVIVDVFYSQFQTSPLDLFTDNFYASRREVIERRLVAISESTDEVLWQFVLSGSVQRKLYFCLWLDEVRFRWVWGLHSKNLALSLLFLITTTLSYCLTHPFTSTWPHLLVGSSDL